LSALSGKRASSGMVHAIPFPTYFFLLKEAKMRWDFWNKKNQKTGDVKPQKPKDLTTELGRKLVVEKKYDPDWVWSLKMVTKRLEGETLKFYYRVFDPLTLEGKNLKISAYSSLDDHPELVLFDGVYEKNSSKVEINDHLKMAEKKAVA
jgi:hypothetical protein